jgi:hypothetical protein
MGKLVLRKTILRNMIDRVWAALGENEIMYFSGFQYFVAISPRTSMDLPYLQV